MQSGQEADRAEVPPLPTAGHAVPSGYGVSGPWPVAGTDNQRTLWNAVGLNGSLPPTDPAVALPCPAYTGPVPHRLTVGDIMTREVVTLTEDDTLADAKRCMELGRLRHLPVLRGSTLVGLITHRDLLAASFSMFAEVSNQEQLRLFRQIPVRELMHDAFAVPPTMRVRDAAGVMLEKQYGCLPVVDENRTLLGIVTEADFLHLTVRMLDAIRA